jgi:hypothetical protein
MSPRRTTAAVIEQEEADRQATADAEATLVDAEQELESRLVNAAMELIAKREQERREHRTKYRELVLRAADNGGQLPQSDIDRLVDLVEAMGLTVEEFQRDVSAVYVDREYDEKIAALVDQQISARREHDAAAEEEQNARREFSPIREAYEAKAREYDQRMTAAKQRRDKAAHAMDRLSRQSSDIGTKQTYARGNAPRIWGA